MSTLLLAISYFFSPGLAGGCLWYNQNHEIIHGRRGTGKTHILRVLQNELEDKHTHCFFFDCSQTGSAGEISDEELPVNYRAVRLMRDFLMALYSDLNYYFGDLLCTHPKSDEIQLLLNHLYMECYFSADVTQTYERTHNYEVKSAQNDEDSEEISFFNPKFSLARGSRSQREKGLEASYKTSGTSYKKVVFPDIYHCLNDLSKITGIEFYMLIDEWAASIVKLDAQEIRFTGAINREKEKYDELIAQTADLDQDELTDARLALRQQMEREAQDRIRRAERGKKISFWNFQGSISDTDKLLGEDGMAERCEERKRLRRMQEHQRPKREARSRQRER